MVRYLTKSRFRLALECITKLYYVKKKDYADESLDDPFLLALAEGGFQVGELAKFLFSENPTKEDITITTLDYQESLAETAKRLQQKDVVIAEAAFSFNSLFIRADIIVKHANIIHLYEVKAKSTDGEDIDFISKKKEPRIISKWAPYLYDIAFQKYVISKSLEREKPIIRANILLVDKSKISTIDGLNQKFKIIKTQNGSRVEIDPNMKKEELGEPILKIQNVDDEIERIWNEFPVPNDYSPNMRFDKFVNMCEKIYSNDELIYAPLGSKCRDCQFINSDLINNPSLKSGFHECWQNKTRLGERLYKDSLVIDLWGGLMGSRSLVQELIDNGKYLISDLNEQDVIPKSNDKSYHGLSPYERRMQQINRVKKNIKESYFDKKRFDEVKRNWVYPLHMIDFETSMPALPFHKDMHPYEGIAFQFSHHIMEANGEIRHAGQYLSFEKGVFPNYEFVRQLKLQLENDSGTIFRYHNHENTYLNFIHNQLQTDPEPPDDKESLCGFIKHITINTNNKLREEGPRNMVDLWDLVLRFYYSPNAKGSNSIKAILPAIISESDFLKDKYSKPIYGRNKLVHSLNFDEHIWIDPSKNYDPYKTLPKLFDEYSIEVLDKFSESIGEFKEVADGGAAMTAYNYLQFSHIPDDQREMLKNGLLRYCELDTMAMVMILEGWFNKSN